MVHMGKTASSFMLIGPIEAGKSTLFKAMFGREGEVRKTQAVEFEAGNIDTPGEYFSHPRLYHALINTASGVDTLVYVHPANVFDCRIPPGLFNIYEGKRLTGVISKVDLPDADPDRVEKLLCDNGLSPPIFRVSKDDPESTEKLKLYLLRAADDAVFPS